MLFNVPSMPDYGRLSKRPLDEMIAGARVEVAPYKRGDRTSCCGSRRRPASRAGRRPPARAPGGRAGTSMLGDELEASRRDLRHPWRRHRPGVSAPRERDRAIALRLRTPAMANYWMHNGFLQVEGEKMSKSLGNFFTIREVLADWQGDVIRLAMLQRITASRSTGP